MKRYKVRPSKAVSLMQFIMSAVFSIVGISISIVLFVNFPLRFIRDGVQLIAPIVIILLVVFTFLAIWTGIAIWACINSAKNAFTQKGAAYEYKLDVEEDTTHKLPNRETSFVVQHSIKGGAPVKRYRVRQSRASSIVGVITGIGMSIIGVIFFVTAVQNGQLLTIVFMIVWIILTISGVVINAKNAFTKKGVAYQYIEEIEEEPAYVSSEKNLPKLRQAEMKPQLSDADMKKLREDLEKLEWLLDSGTITKPQYEKAKVELLRRNLQKRV